MNSSFKTYQITLRVSLALVVLIFMGGCNGLKHVPEGKRLYTGAQVKVKAPDKAIGVSDLRSAANDALFPKPNSKILGMRLGLWSYYKVNVDSSAGFYARFIYDKFGEDPVYLEDVDPPEIEKLIQNRAVNHGFFYPRTNYSVTENEKTAEVDYQLDVGKPFLLETYQFQRDSLRIDSLIHRSVAKKTSLLPKGSRFDLEVFKDERKRIDSYLKEKGYFQFNSDYLIFTSDTNQYKAERFDLYLDVKDKVPYQHQLPYLVKEVYVYPDYSLETNLDQPYDTVTVKGLHFMQSKLRFKPELLRKYIIVEPDQLYDKDNSTITTRRLTGLPPYQFASIRYHTIDSLRNDSLGFLEARIMLTPAERYSLRMGVQGVTKSTGFAGPGLNFTFEDRNMFKGGERFETSAQISYEFQVSSRGEARGLNNLQFKLENSLTLPRLIAPFVEVDARKVYSIPNTRFALNYTLQHRGLFYTINSFEFKYGYNWKSTERIYWEFNPLGISYMRVSNQSERFREILRENQFLARSFESQFIPEISGTWQYNEIGLTKSNNEFYANLDVAEAGGITQLMAGNAANSTDDREEILGLPYAQYLKADLDLRHYLKIDEKKTWANRIFAGVGYPYGNSQSLPYIKQYFSGGPNSVRAFDVRGLGPGSYNPPDTGRLSFFDQSGDIRLELNTEYRFPIAEPLRGAVFVDAGNIWLWNDNSALPGGAFSSDWLNQMAIGAGFGFRIDVDILVIRLDLGHPLRYPYEKDGGHWVGQPSFGEIVWNFAIGYPF